MMELIRRDKDSVTTPVMPRRCDACEEWIDRLHLMLDVSAAVTPDGPVGSVTAFTETPCCGARRPAGIPGEIVASAIEHVNNCPNH